VLLYLDQGKQLLAKLNRGGNYEITPFGNTYSLTIGKVGAGTVTSTPTGITCGITCIASFTSGTNVTLTAAPATGSSFTGWSGDCSGLTTCEVPMNAAKSVSASFSTNSGGDLSVSLALAQGWNLLGNSLTKALPMSPTFSNPAVVTTVWKRDVATSGWQFYAPTLDAAALQSYAASKGYSVLSVINPGEGYWVNAKTSASLGTQTGAAFNLAAANLAAGWNLVATGNDVSPSAFNLSLSATPPAAGVVPINLTSLWAWDNPLSQWYFYAPSLESSNGLASYITSKSYLDFTSHNKKLGNGTGFWVNKP
jgi:hypothetical protein